ncbi:MAG TPA: HupE/UreJ family protein [Rariglobus sp.]|jgi:urease accessory protein|nr:HupE/UreJ family protein [Rariglobus sp.]
MPTKSLRTLLKGFVLLAAIPAIASAHPGHDGGHGFGWDFSSGFAHPLGGWDHLLAMIAVGLWAAQLGGRARWLVPAAFVSVMTLGAILGHGGMMIAGTEQGIAASVLVLGLLVATAARLPVALGMAVTGVFALFHGLAHGAEMPANAAGLQYGLGFVLATALLHAAGLGLGLLTARKSAVIPQTAGAAIALVGVAMLAI